MIPKEIQQAMYGFMMSHVLFTADELGVFDYIAQGKGSTSADLGQLTGINPDTLERLLLGAASMGLLTRKKETYVIPDHLEPFLAKSSPNYCGGAFSHFREISTKTFLFLKNGLEEDKPQWSKVLDKGEDYSPFTELYNDQKRLENFLSSMWGLGYEPAKELVKQYPLNQHKMLVDVGGATGSFSISALEAYPSLKAIVFDLPAVGQCLKNKAIEHGVSDRLTFVQGDFFKDELPEGDVYVLGYILSDWNRKDGTRLLKKIYDRLPKGGLVLVLEKLFDEDKNGPIETAMMNLGMLLETWGKHYSGSEYMDWLEEIGFHNCQIFRSSGEKHMVIGIK